MWCRATNHIPIQIDTIRGIEAKGFTYHTSDGIYFDTAKLLTYGYLGRLDIAGLRAGMRIDMGKNATPPTLRCGSSAPPSTRARRPIAGGLPGWWTRGI
jgi:cysteinyl-tRNA synthetase